MDAVIIICNEGGKYFENYLVVPLGKTDNPQRNRNLTLLGDTSDGLILFAEIEDELGCVVRGLLQVRRETFTNHLAKWGWMN